MKKTLKLVSLLIALCMVCTVVFAACQPDCGVGNHVDENHDGVCDVCKRATTFKHVDDDDDRVCDVCGKDIVYTRNNYMSTTPSNWNELDSTDNNDSAIMGYIGSSFFTYDFKFEGGKFNADGSLNVDGIVEGAFDVKYDAATALEDVTETYGDTWGLTQKQIQAGGYIWKITLRQDLKWDDGTAIKAEDFVYTMQEQLNPKFFLGRSSEYYQNAVKIHNAQNYLYQGQSGWYDNAERYTYEDFDPETGTLDGNEAVIVLKEKLSWLGGYTIEQAMTAYAGYLDAEAFAELQKLADANGRVAITETSLQWLEQLITANPDWDETEEEVVNYMYYKFTWPEVDFDEEVGIFSVGDYDIVLVCDQPMQFFKEDGETLSYLAAYNFGSLPLVKRDLYERCKQEPQAGSDLWTTTYCTSLETSASWGPYKLTFLQNDKQFILERNENWYGYGIDEYKGQFQVDRIVTDIIKTEAASQTAFWAGQVDSLGISVTLANDYRNSIYALYSPRIATFGIQVFSDLATLKAHDRNNGILSILEFRQAMSLSLDRDEYNTRLSTANQTALGLMGEDYYHDVENSGIYRNTDQAKSALLRVYGFEFDTDQGKWKDSATGRTFATIDDAVDAMTGVNMALAKQKVEEAWTELTSNATEYGYDSSKPIILLLGASEASEAADREHQFIQEWISNLVQGTSMEGKIRVDLKDDLGDTWADAFKAGDYDLSSSGIGNAPFDPFYLIGAHLNLYASVTYHPYWATDEEEVSFTIPQVDGDYDGKDEGEITMTIEDWYACLNGYAGVDYNWGAGFAPVEVRLEILAMLEEVALLKYYTLPTARGMTAALHSAKFHYVTDIDNTMMGFGGIQYMQYDFADDEWAAFVKVHKGDLRDFYKQTA